MRTSVISICVCVGLWTTLAAANAQANLLVDPSYESNALMPLGLLVNNFNANQGIWGVEGTATRVLAEPPVYPPDGDYMLRMPPTAGSEIQAFQITDLTAYASLIDSGNAIIHAGALYNAHEDVAAAVGGVRLWFYENPVWNTHNTVVQPTTYLGIDGDPSTWEGIGLSATVPANTRWVITDLFFVNASLDDEVGYIDVPYMYVDVVPEPSSMLLMVVAGALVLARFAWHRRRRSNS